MQLRIEPFIYTCQVIIDYYLSVLCEVSKQKEMWFTKNPPLLTCTEFLEDFIEELEEFLSTPEYSHFELTPALIRLKQLYEKVEHFYESIEPPSKCRKEKALFADTTWNDIRHLAIKVREELQDFLHTLHNDKELQ